MNRSLYLTIFLALLFYIVVPLFNSVNAANLRFNPTSGTVRVGSTVDFDVRIDTGGEAVTSADAYIEYDPNFVEIVSVTDGNFFQTVTHNDVKTSGRLYIAGIVTNAATFKIGEGLLASVKLKGLKNGDITLRYICEQGSTTDSNIAKNDINATDIISCSDNNTYKLTIGSSSNPNDNNTNNNSNTGGSTSNNNQSSNYQKPNTLPQTGTVEKVILGSVLGIGLFVIGGVIKLFL